MKKRILAVAFATAIAVSVCGLAGCSGARSAELSYADGITEDGTYDTDLFYRNDLRLNHAADPGCLWVSEEQGGEEYGGYFYLYTTSLYYNIAIMRSKDLDNWESVGHALEFTGNQWFGTTNSANIWAPEVIYDPETEMYFMYSSGSTDGKNQKTEMFIAVSDNPAGGFRMIGEDAAVYGEEFTTDAYGHRFTSAECNFSFRRDHVAPAGADFESWIHYDLKTDVDVAENSAFYGLWAIDPSPFIDDDGQWYVYFRCNREFTTASDYNSVTRLAVVKMINPWTPDYSSLTFVAYPGFQSAEAVKANTPFVLEFTGRAYTSVNEAPFMIKHDGIYYLTYAFGGYTQRDIYCVAMAVSENPTGPFVKLAGSHGNPSLFIEGYMDQMAGPGHHAFVPVGDEIFVVYHSMMDRANGASNPRGIAVDRVQFISGSTFGITASEYGITNGNGTFDVIYSNGPSWSLQPKPAAATGYKNLAPDAIVTATNGNEDTVKYLNDGLYAAHTVSSFMEYEAHGKTKITLVWTQPVKIRAVMVYNSFDYYFAFSQVDRIDFNLAESLTNEKGELLNSVYIKDLAFHSHYWNAEDGFEFMRPGGSCHASFNEITVTSITVTVSKKLDTKYKEEGDTIKISDIVVLGKEV